MFPGSVSISRDNRLSRNSNLISGQSMIFSSLRFVRAVKRLNRVKGTPSKHSTRKLGRGRCVGGGTPDIYRYFRFLRKGIEVAFTVSRDLIFRKDKRSLI